MRFSTRVAGDIVISYVADGVCEHLLVNPPEDFVGGRRLDDIVRYDYEDLRYLYPNMPKEEVFSNPTNIKNPKRLDGYRRVR